MAEIKEIINYSISDKFQLEDIAQRKLYINGEIDETIIDDVVYFILKWNRDDKGKSIEERQPILLYCSSCGGSVDDGFALIDTILVSKTPIYTINLSYWYSMGFLIGLAANRRYATKNAKFLMHDGQNFVWNSSSKVKDQMKFQELIEQRVKEYILSRSKLTSKEYDDKLRVEWYMYSDEAKEKNFVDYIIGEDCDIDEII